MSALLLVAHGSSNEQSNAIVERIAHRCATLEPGLRVQHSFLDHGSPTPAQALLELAGEGFTEVIATPLLFTAAYHAQVDLPAEISAAKVTYPDLRVRIAESLVPHEALLDALDARLDSAITESGVDPPDALVLASAGTSDVRAQEAIASFARRWQERRGVAVRASFASAAAPAPGAAVLAMRLAGAQRVGVGSLFLGPGFLPDRARKQALAAGAVAISRPLGDCPEIARVVLDRFAAMGRRPTHLHG